VSAGGTIAATVAARRPEVERLVLISAMGWLPYPDRWTRLGAQLAFRGGVERVTWGGIHRLFKAAPDVGLRMMMRSLSTRPVGEVLAGLRDEQRALLVDPTGPRSPARICGSYGVREKRRTTRAGRARQGEPGRRSAASADRAGGQLQGGRVGLAVEVGPGELDLVAGVVLIHLVGERGGRADRGAADRADHVAAGEAGARGR
jgi:pimeloyl-ACP methyl ester carboxylesterase